MNSARMKWCALAVALVLAVGLAACKSSPRKAVWTQASQPAPSIVQPTYPTAPGFPDATPATPPSAVSQADLDAAQDAAQLERDRNQDLERQLRLEQERLASAEDRLKNMEAKIAELETPPTGPLVEPDMSVPTVDAPARLADELRARSTATVIREGEMVVVRVTNSFKAGSDLLKQDVQLVQTLNATADALSRYPGATVAVVGHSDTDPINKSKDRWANNDELSMARAQRVAQVLADNGVDRNRISIDGRGAREPLVSPERTLADKAANRRVEIMIRP